MARHLIITGRFQRAAMFSGRHWSGEVAAQPAPNVGLGAFDAAPLSQVPFPDETGGAALGADDVDSTMESGIIHGPRIQRSLIVGNTFVVRSPTTPVVGFAA